jgi:hypothetical protein
MLKNILNSIKLKKRDKKQEVDEVYSFFAYSKSNVRKRAYEGALRMTQKDQMAILKKAKLIKE